MTIETIEAGPVRTNCYRIIGEDQTAAVIDPGYYTEELIQWVKQPEVSIRAILLTHGHFDHIAGLSELQKQTGADVYMHAADAEMLTDPVKNASQPYRQSVVYSGPVHLLQDGDVVSVGKDLQFQLLHTPGHTKGSSVYRIQDVLFSGDTLFYREIGRCDCYGGSLATMFGSLRKLAAIPGVGRVFPGHGPGTELTAEVRENPYILQAVSEADSI